MTPLHCLAPGALLFLVLAAQAQAPANPAAPATPASAPISTTATTAEAPAASALDSDLFLQLLVGEINARGEDVAAGFALMLDAARRTGDPVLYRRAVEIAYQARQGENALLAVRAWKQALPGSREANRLMLQILVALNRVAETLEPLRGEIALAEPKDANAVVSLIPRTYARVTDKKMAASVVEQALRDVVTQPALGVSAWATIGRMRLMAGDPAGALAAATQALALNPRAELPALLALELMDPRTPQAEQLVRRYIDGKPLPEIRMAYARNLLEAQRYAEAAVQLKAITADKPDFAEAWLVQGTLQVQDNQNTQAEASLKRYVELAQGQRSAEERNRGLAQAYLMLSQIAEKRKDFEAAGAWLDRIENSQDLMSAQNRRASILARQGRMDDARKLLRALPEREPADARTKIMAEVQLLREFKQLKPAYELLAGASTSYPKDVELIYEQAMLAEKLGDLAEMERLLRLAIEIKPDYHHAYNALGYSLAERNIRLPEARQLIQKALTLAPGDPFISDSLGWVEFRMGNLEEALRILDAAFRMRPDAEIAAHLGEVLWVSGQRERAQSIWREGLMLNAENDTLRETLKRLRVRP